MHTYACNTPVQNRTGIEKELLPAKVTRNYLELEQVLIQNFERTIWLEPKLCVIKIYILLYHIHITLYISTLKTILLVLFIYIIYDFWPCSSSNLWFAS